MNAQRSSAMALRAISIAVDGIMRGRFGRPRLSRSMPATHPNNASAATAQTVAATPRTTEISRPNMRMIATVGTVMLRNARVLARG